MSAAAARRPGRPPSQLGRRIGDWRVLAVVGRHHLSYRYEVACVRCDRRRSLPARDLHRLSACRCDRSRPERLPPIVGAPIDHWTPWEEDDRCWYAVACHPEGLSTSEIGQLMGLSAEGVRLIEQAAIRKLREAPPEVLRDLLEATDEGGWVFPGDPEADG